MSASELLQGLYSWVDVNALLLLAGALALPPLATLLAWLGSRGRTAEDGRRIASACLALALGTVALEALSLLLAHYAFGKSPLDANVLLLVAPPLCLAGCAAGIRLVFPLGEIGSARAAVDVGLFLLAGAVALWLLSKFRGWGFLFLGSIADFAAIAALAFLLMRRLYRRAAGDRTTALARRSSRACDHPTGSSV